MRRNRKTSRRSGGGWGRGGGGEGDGGGEGGARKENGLQTTKAEDTEKNGVDEKGKEGRELWEGF